MKLKCKHCIKKNVLPSKIIVNYLIKIKRHSYVLFQYLFLKLFKFSTFSSYISISHFSFNFNQITFNSILFVSSWISLKGFCLCITLLLTAQKNSYNSKLHLCYYCLLCINFLILTLLNLHVYLLNVYNFFCVSRKSYLQDTK